MFCHTLLLTSTFGVISSVVATSSVGGLGGAPGMVGGARLVSTGPGTVSASLGGTYDFLGGLGSNVYGLVPGAAQ